MPELSPTNKEIKVWDLPVRLFHWTLVLLFAVSWASAEIGDNMTIHFYSGYAVLALVLFRVLWGIFGSTTARFAHFLRGYRAAKDYAVALKENRAIAPIGHNPLGGWMVMLMLTFLLVQAGTGLFANDDVSTEGPLYHLISKDVSDILTEIHEVSFNILLALVGVHIAAVLYYRFIKRDNLVTPMITGRKSLVSDAPEPDIRFVGGWLALLLFGLAAGAVALLVING